VRVALQYASTKTPANPIDSMGYSSPQVVI
jgi:hypothetical protein